VPSELSPSRPLLVCFSGNNNNTFAAEAAPSAGAMRTAPRSCAPRHGAQLHAPWHAAQEGVAQAAKLTSLARSACVHAAKPSFCRQAGAFGVTHGPRRRHEAVSTSRKGQRGHEACRFNWQGGSRHASAQEWHVGRTHKHTIYKHTIYKRERTKGQCRPSHVKRGMCSQAASEAQWPQQGRAATQNHIMDAWQQLGSSMTTTNRLYTHTNK